MNLEKKCSKCKIFKSIDDFYCDNSRKDKKSYTCKDCAKLAKLRKGKYSPDINLKEKKCITCNIIRDIENFSLCPTSATGYRGECRDCNSVRNAIRSVNVKNNFFDEWGPYACEHCNLLNYDIIQFHHKNPKEKEFDVGTLLITKNKWPIALKEIEKCIPLCPTCHMLEHARIQKREHSNKIERQQERIMESQRIEALELFYKSVTGNDVAEVTKEIVDWEIQRIFHEIPNVEQNRNEEEEYYGTIVTT